MIDSRPGYFDCDDLRDYGDWCDWDDPDEGEGYYDPFWPPRAIWMVALMCVVLLEWMIIMHRLKLSLCMKCMDRITVECIVSCNMRSDHMTFKYAQTYVEIYHEIHDLDCVDHTTGGR